MLLKRLVSERQLLAFELDLKVNALLNYFFCVLAPAVKTLNVSEVPALGRSFQGHSWGNASSAQQSDCCTVGWVCN